MRRAAGFTLVELVMVIVLLAIVATISVQFVAFSTQGAIDASDRQQRALKAVVVSEQITRMLREAHPLSIRRTGPTNNCLEWQPIEGATRYSRLPQGGGTEIEVVPFYEEPTGDGMRAVVYGYGGPTADVADWFYSSPLSNPGPISPPIANFNNNTDPATITLTSSHRFTAQSPARRVFVVSQPNSLCSESGNLLVLYSNYNIDESYGSGTSAILVGDLGGPAEFTFTPATLRRSALVTFSFELMSPGSSETLNVSQEVQIRNVP